MPPFGSEAESPSSFVDLVAYRRRAVLASGRTYQLDSDGHDDRLTVRNRRGEVVLRIEMGERGPVLSFECAEVELRARERLVLDSEQIEIRSRHNLALNCGGDMTTVVDGDSHKRTRRSEQLEAARIEMQANTEHVHLQAMERVSLDGSHVGLNDSPCPRPFAWSCLGEKP